MAQVPEVALGGKSGDKEGICFLNLGWGGGFPGRIE